jgi:signal transduction histidine kinase
MAGVIALSVPFIIFIVTIYSFKFDRRNSLIFLSAIFFFLTGSMIYSLKELGFFPYNFYTENMLMIGSVFEIALFSIALGEKFKLIQLENANKEVELLKEKQQRTEIEITNSRNSLIAEYASQVAHDIRSPLSALTMVAGTLTDIPEEKRVMIRNATQRINDIANGLLQKGKMIGKDKGASEAQSNSVIEKSIEFIPALVDILVSEKRMQFREHNDLEIVTDLKNSFGSFAIINSTELKRVLSNLINNAVEAFDNFKGTITVGVQKITTTTGSHVEIFVSDNGKGIPEHLINKLGQIGVSHGKASSGQSGSGLGLYHAKQTAESFSGKLEISSTEGKGSVIKFILPLADAPKWFAQKIDLSGKKYLVSLDDDSSIHQIWTERLQSLASDPLFKNIEHIKFQSGEAFEKYVNAHINMMKETLFLVDFELLNQPKTGLDWIEDLAIEKHAILVTSRYEEKDIQVRAARLNLQLLPKSLAGFVPFEIQKPKLKFDAVLLDDDDLVIATWRMAAKDRSKSILCFANRDELFAKLSEIDHNCAFYVDENLGNGLKGEFVTKELFDLGFKNLHLATGYPSDQFKHVTWVKSIVGKDPVFD